MTKTEYRQYVGSEHWQQRRKEFLLHNDNCNRCDLPRWLAALVYDQDLHVHHKSYANVGAEQDADLEVLCRRCHEIATFGHSEWREIWSRPCERCGELIYDRFYPGVCEYCMGVREGFSAAKAGCELDDL